MKTRIIRIATVAFLIAFAGVWWSRAQSGTKVTTKEVMMQKLEFAHYILNGVATDNFDLIAKNADQLARLSHESAWRARESADYEVLSAEFRRQVEALAKAAKDRNSDAASLAYVQMTLSCVNCHKYMRGGKKAGEF